MFNLRWFFSLYWLICFSMTYLGLVSILVHNGHFKLFLTIQGLLQGLGNSQFISFLRAGQMIDLFAVDNSMLILYNDKRVMELCYVFLSTYFNARIIFKIRFVSGYLLKTAMLLFAAANWLEREAWDMYGVVFLKHVELRRILTDYGFKGHPLRKWFPLTGFSEVWYVETFGRTTYFSVKFSQSYRVFGFQERVWDF